MKAKKLGSMGILAILAVVVFVGIIVLIMNFNLQTDEGKPRVGCVLIGTRDDQGWNESHYEGLLEACKAQGCDFQVVENVPEKRMDVSQAVEGLIEDKCNVIFLTSYGYGKYAAPIAKAHQETAFYVISGDETAENLTTYFARLYQVRYLAGIVAGAATKTNTLGYVASSPNSQTNCGINAYTLGARLANPKAKVIVHWTRSWNDEAEEKKAVKRLKEKGADVIAYHSDKAYSIEAAEVEGLYSIGYDAIYGEWSDKFLTASLYDWGMLYTQIIEDYLSGRANFSREYLMGLQEKAVKLADFSPLVSDETKRLLAQESERIMTARDVFSGVIYDNAGRLRCEEDERISDEEMFAGMNWFVEGVENDKE
ncbi:MAG: BMP family ABC transporter substrate-binding protein [Lachnospiraceae bacterium]|nr:BMP family ABC transporter substrate-binding protein [Lachnospiraceae bacterium]